jgi:hypothetical protein
MRWRALALLALLCGCRSWAPPDVQAVQAGDRRSCNRNHCVDLVIVIDTSASMAEPVSGYNPTLLEMLFPAVADAGPDSRLWIGLDGIASAVKSLDPDRVGIALTGFAGDFDTPSTRGGESWVELGITDDYAAVDDALVRIRSRGASGGSCHACAVTLARTLLPSASANRCQAVVMVADADPTQPHGPENEDANQQEFVQALVAPELGNFTLLSVGRQRDGVLERLHREVSPHRGAVAVAADAPAVAAAIMEAVESCE